jgi:hypothetical protein
MEQERVSQLNRLEQSAVPRLQREWVEYVQGVLQRHNDSGDTINGVVVDMRGPAWIVARCAVVVAGSAFGLFVVELIRLVRQ